MTRQILSDQELGELDDELFALVVRQPKDVLSEMVRPTPANNRAFPVDGYITWQQRWRLGTGVEPEGWQSHDGVV